MAIIRAGYRTHAATEEAAGTRHGFLRLTKGGQTSSDSDRVLAELARERFNRPHPTAVSGPLDEIRQAFVERTLDVSTHAASKVSLVAAFAKITPDKSPEPETKAKKAAADKMQGRNWSGNMC